MQEDKRMDKATLNRFATQGYNDGVQGRTPKHDPAHGPLTHAENLYHRQWLVGGQAATHAALAEVPAPKPCGPGHRSPTRR